MSGRGDTPATAGDGDLLAGPLAAFAGALCWDDSPGAIPAAELADRRCFDALMGRFSVAHACHDRRAAISFWSQIYFSRLIVAGVAATLSRGRALPLDLDAVRVSFCADTGAALVFRLNASDPPEATEALFARLIDRHVAPLIAVLQRHSGLSARLLWENAGWPLCWMLGETARLRLFRPTVDQLLGARVLQDRRPHPLGDMLRSACLGAPIRRRVCCLRHRIPGFGRCPGLCPIAPAGGDPGPIG